MSTTREGRHHEKLFLPVAFNIKLVNYMSPKFQVYKDSAGKTRFRLRADNGKIVAVGEAYKKYASAIAGIKSIQKNANSPVEDLTVEGGPKHPNPKYEIFKDAKGKFRFHLKAANGEIIAQGEGYESKEGALNGIEVVKQSINAEIEDPFAVKKPEEPAPPETLPLSAPKFQVYKDAAGKTRFRLRATNGRIIVAGEAYEQYASCLVGISSVQRNSESPVEDLTVEGAPKYSNPKYQILKDAAGKYRFHLKASNGEIIAQGEGYETKEACLNGIELVKRSKDAEIEDPFAKKPAETKVETKTEVTAIEEAPKPQPPMVEPVTPLVEVKPEVPPPPEAKTEEIPKVEPPKIETVPLPETKPEIPTPPTPVTPAPEIPTPTIPTPPPASEIPTPPAPAAAVEMPEEIGPVETKLDLEPMPGTIPKGTHVAFKGKLHGGKADKGIPGAKIQIWEEDNSILGDEYLAYGTTGDDGTFNIEWHARGLSWRKKTGEVYARFKGNEKAKPAKSQGQTLTFQ